MEKALLTVAEYADLEGISKQAVYRRLKNDNWKDAHSQVVGGKLFINLDSFDDLIGKSTQKLNQQVDELLKEVEQKNVKIAELQEQVKKLEDHIVDLTAGWREAQRNVSLLQGRLLLEADQDSDQGADPEPEGQEQPEKQGFFTRIFGR